MKKQKAINKIKELGFKQIFSKHDLIISEPLQDKENKVLTHQATWCEENPNKVYYSILDSVGAGVSYTIEI